MELVVVGVAPEHIGGGESGCRGWMRCTRSGGLSRVKATIHWVSVTATVHIVEVRRPMFCERRYRFRTLRIT
jgi:hypothetical protein